MSVAQELKIIEVKISESYGPAVLGELRDIAADPDLVAYAQKAVDELGYDQVVANVMNGIKRMQERRPTPTSASGE